MISKLNTQRARTLQDLRDFTAGNDAFDLEPASHHEGNRLIGRSRSYSKRELSNTYARRPRGSAVRGS